MMRSLFLALSVWLSLCCAVSAQGVPNSGAAMVPNQAPFVGFSVLSKSGVASSHTGDTNETALATVAIPPNTIGANGQIKINAYWTVTNNADTKTLRVRLGGTGVSGTAIFSLGATTVGAVWSSTVVVDLNATNSQNNFNESARGTDGLVTTTNTTSSIDMTQAQNIVLSGLLGTVTDTITLVGYSIEVAN